MTDQPEETTVENPYVAPPPTPEQLANLQQFIDAQKATQGTPPKPKRTRTKR